MKLSAPVIAFAIVMSTVPAVALAQTKPMADYCKSNPCQKNVEVRLTTANGKPFVHRIEWMPAPIVDNMVVVALGQTIVFDATPTDTLLKDYKQVVDGRRVGLVSLALEQLPDRSFQLTIINPYDRPLLFDVNALKTESDKAVPISRCPVPARTALKQRWTGTTIFVAAHKGRLLAKDAPTTCD